jgi:spore coat polysaccharide biosynthesis protein SpsF
LHDVLDRYYQAARAFQADVVVRITADCPIIDPNVVDETVAALIDCPVPIILSQRTPQSSAAANQEFEIKYDFAANRLPPPFHRTFPIGLDTEVCTFAGLERAWFEADQPYQREHVMPYLYEVEGRFRIFQLDHEPDYGDLRWTVDTAQDLVVIRRIFEFFGKRNDFSWKDVLELYHAQPEIFSTNADVMHKSMNDVDHRQMNPHGNSQ